MTAYVGKRLLLLIPTLLGVSVLTFLLIHLIPGDLVTILLGITAGQNEQTRQALIHALHLDRPLAASQRFQMVGQSMLGQQRVAGADGAARPRHGGSVAGSVSLCQNLLADLQAAPQGAETVVRKIVLRPDHARHQLEF